MTDPSDTTRADAFRRKTTGVLLGLGEAYARRWYADDPRARNNEVYARLIAIGRVLSERDDRAALPPTLQRFFEDLVFDASSAP